MKIMFWLLENGYTQRRICDLSDKSPAAVSTFVGGKQWSRDVAEAFLSLGCPLEYIAVMYGDLGRPCDSGIITQTFDAFCLLPLSLTSFDLSYEMKLGSSGLCPEHIRVFGVFSNTPDSGEPILSVSCIYNRAFPCVIKHHDDRVEVVADKKRLAKAIRLAMVSWLGDVTAY